MSHLGARLSDALQSAPSLWLANSLSRQRTNLGRLSRRPARQRGSLREALVVVPVNADGFGRYAALREISYQVSDVAGREGVGAGDDLVGRPPLVTLDPIRFDSEELRDIGRR